MKCDEAERSIHLLLDGEARAAEASGLFQHMAACESCRHFYDQLTHTNVLIARRRLEAQEIPVHASVRQNQFRFDPRQLVRAPRVSTVALWFAIGMLVFMLLSTSVTQEKPVKRNVPEYSLSPDLR